MKKLQLKVKDLTNPNILSSNETKNIFGGSTEIIGSGTNCCAYYYQGGYAFYSDANLTEKEAKDAALIYAINMGNGHYTCGAGCI